MPNITTTFAPKGVFILIRGGRSGFEINDDGVLIRTRDKGNKLVVPYSLRERESTTRQQVCKDCSASRRTTPVHENPKGLVLAFAGSRLIRNGVKMPELRKKPHKVEEQRARTPSIHGESTTEGSVN